MKRLSHLVLLTLIFLSANLLHAENLSVSGTASGRWDSDTVKVNGDLTVPEDSLLLIDPGTVVMFYGHYKVIMRGTVIANGTAEEMIRFTVSDTTGFTDTLTTAGGWHGFFYDHMPPSADTSVFDYCIFEYGKAVSADTVGMYGGVFRIFNFGKIRFNRCTFKDNLAYRWGGAVYAKYADIRVNNCDFINNRCGKATLPYGYGGALCFVHSSPVVMNNYFELNRSTGIGGAASFEYSDAIVRFNTFYQNNSGLGGAIGYMRSSPVNTVSDNQMDGNSAVFFGGAIACIRSYTTFVNNTVVNNLAMYGGGFYANDSACPSNYNTIFYNNLAGLGNEVYIFDVISAPNFYYCNVPGGKEAFQGSGGQQGYHGEYVNNYDTVPMFSGTNPYPFELLPESPLVDAGTPDTTGLQIPPRDMAGNDRVENGRIDVGAFEWDPNVGVKNIIKKAGLVVSPNPCHEMVTISLPEGINGILSARIIDLNGGTVRIMNENQFNPDGKSLNWDLTSDNGTLVDPGIYLVVLSGKGWRNTAKIEVIR